MHPAAAVAHVARAGLPAPVGVPYYYTTQKMTLHTFAKLCIDTIRYMQQDQPEVPGSHVLAAYS